MASTGSHPSPGRPERLSELLATLVPGILFGVHFATLLFYLNPRIEFSVATVGRAGAAFAALFTIVWVVVQKVWLRRRGRTSRQILPWAVTLSLFLAATAQWAHASLFAFYLPPGINNRLIKAAVGVSIATLVCFYTALLHTVQRRRYGVRSRLVIGIFVCLSVFISIERRHAYTSVPERAPATAELTRNLRLRLLVIGLEGATLDAILPLAEQGHLPFLATLLQQGVYGRLSTLSPVRRLPVWYTLATGTYPYRHGVVSDSSLTAFFLPRRSALSLVPWTSGLQRWGTLVGVRNPSPSPPSRAPALWRILESLGVSTTVLGWPALEADLAQATRFLGPRFSRLSDTAPALSEDNLRLWARARRIRPSLAAADPDLFSLLGDDAPESVKEAVLGDLWRAETAREVLSTNDDVVFLGIPGLLDVSLSFFGGYAAVQFDGESQDRQQRASQILAGYYRLLDDELARLWDTIPSPRLLVVVSAYGVREPSGWRRLWSTFSPGSSIPGRIDGAADGALLLLGDGLRSGTFLDRAQLTDLAPTLLYGLGAPVARDMDGKVLTAAFGTTFLNRTPLTFVPSYSSLAAASE